MPAIRNTRLPKQDRKNYGEDHRETYGIMYLKPEPENMITPPFATDISLSPLARSSSSPSWLSGVPSYSHRPKQDHSPRPPNAFLFRPELYKAPKLHLGEDQTNISRIAGQRWKDLAEHEQEPYKRRAKHEKQLHDRRDPDYKYSLSGGCRSEKKVGRKGKKDRKESEEERCRKVAELLIQGIEGADLQRAMKSVDEEASTLSSSSTSRSQCPRPKNTASSHIRVESPQPPDFFFFDHSGSHPNGNFVPTSQIPQLKLSAATPEEDAGDAFARGQQRLGYDATDVQFLFNAEVSPFEWDMFLLSMPSPGPAGNTTAEDWSSSIVHSPSAGYEFDSLINGTHHVRDQHADPTSPTTVVEPTQEFDDSQYMNYDCI